MAKIFDRLVTDEEFVSRVRRHSPSSMLPLIAAAASRYWQPNSWFDSPYKKYVPWALAEVARVSLAYGNEYRSTASERDLLHSCAAYTAMGDPELSKSPEGIVGFFLRLGNEQLSFQQPYFNDFARTQALLGQTTPSHELDVIVGSWAEELFGCTLSEYAGTLQFLQIAAVNNNGLFDIDWLNRDAFKVIVAEVSRYTMERLILDHLVTDRDKFKATNARFAVDANRTWRRFTFNSLLTTPLVSGLHDMLLVPAPLYLNRRASPLGIYYAGIQKWGNRFAEDLGELFEQYIGRQLRLIPNATVIPEIVYGKDNKKSIDWFVVMDRVVLLVEVKSRRPTEAVRKGSTDAASDLKRLLNGGMEQIERSVALIKDRHPAFTGIPVDRPLIGVVVTLEPFFTLNAPFLRELLHDPGIPNSFASASELESLVTVEEPLDELLLSVLNDPSKPGWSLGSLIEGRPFRRNEVLDRAWESYPWSSLESETA